MSFRVNVRLGELSATTSLSELSASVTISGGLLRSIPFSANKDTELEFADTITFSVDNPSPDVEYIWRLEDGQGFDLKEGTQVKQDYTEEGQYDVKVLGHYLNQQRLEGVGYKKDFVKVDFQLQPQLLDDVPGAAAAYSVRLLDQNYTDGLLRVRAVDSNGTDQGEADVKPDGNITPQGFVTISLNSPIENLDTIAQGRGLSNSDTLGDLVDSGGANYDGFVPKWYDQSPNARHATNSTASEQPQIVDTGNLIKENGKPALETNGNEFLNINYTLSSVDTSQSIFFVSNFDGNAYLFDVQNGRFLVAAEDGRFIYDGGDQGSGWSLNRQIIGSLYLNKNNGGVVYENNGTGESISYNPKSLDGSIKLFKHSTQNIKFVNGKTQEFILYTDDILSQQGKVENNQNNFYGAF